MSVDIMSEEKRDKSVYIRIYVLTVSCLYKRRSSHMPATSCGGDNKQYEYNKYQIYIYTSILVVPFFPYDILRFFVLLVDTYILYEHIHI